MRKRSCVLFVVALLGVSSASVALEPVTLEPDCAYMMGFDASGPILVGLLQAAGVDELEGDFWNTVDMESVLAELDGDGIPDMYQMALLSAVLCAADKDSNDDIKLQYEANAAAFTAIVDLIVDLFAAAGGLATELTDLAVDLEALGVLLAEPVPDIETCDPAASFRCLALYVGVTGATFGEFISGDLSVLPTMLPMVQDLFGGLAGLSSEMELTMSGLLEGLLDNLAKSDKGLVEDLMGLSAGLMLGADLVEFGLPPLPPPFDDPTVLAGEMRTAAGNIDAFLGILVGLMVPPVFEIYGVTGGKLIDEPFSSFGDYNENDDSNQDVFDAVVGENTPGLRPEFVAAASGANPWYTGNPALPVAGIAGVVLLVGAVAAGGVLAARKK